MHILVLSDNFMPLSNAERVAYLMTKEYLNLGHEVSVITINSKLSNGEVKKMNYEGMTIYQIGSSYHKYLIAYISLYNPWVVNAIRKILNDNEFDFAHLHNIHTHISYSVISLIRNRNIKQIMTAHDYMSIDYGKFTQGIDSNDLSESPRIYAKLNPLKTFWNYKKSYNPFRNIVIKFFLYKLYKIITVSQAQDFLLRENGINNTFTINNGILKYDNTISDNEIKVFKKNYHINEGEKIILWAGRLSDAKGAKQVLEVLSRLLNTDYNVKLLVVGGDIFKNDKLEKHIISPGWLSSEDMRIAYEISNVTLVPSIYPDPFPTVVLESMQSGTPVIATCFGGAKEAVINSKTGFVVNPFNIDYFCNRVEEILNNNELSDDMSKESKKQFNNLFTINNCIKQYAKFVN
jgi:glycosyltransferase involved in cell wall biosynthesis